MAFSPAHFAAGRRRGLEMIVGERKDMALRSENIVRIVAMNRVALVKEQEEILASL
jgi:hypothetical protein